jgi:hypothetical protein
MRVRFKRDYMGLFRKMKSRVQLTELHVQCQWACQELEAQSSPHPPKSIQREIFEKSPTLQDTWRATDVGSDEPTRGAP